MLEMLARGWENFLARPTGPMAFRFLLQPLVALLLAWRAGWKDSREGNPPFLSGSFTRASRFGAVLRGTWKGVRIPFGVGVVLDVIYQWVVNTWVYPLESLVTAMVLVVIPYMVMRGLFTRLATRLFPLSPPSGDAPRADRKTNSSPPND